MTHSYSFSVIRYVHDVVTGEFANVGVVLYSPSAKRLIAETTQAYSRLSAFFGQIDGDHFRKVMRRLNSRIEDLDAEISERDGGAPSVHAAELVGRILPKDDSALQLTPAGAGVTTNLDRTLQQVFERHVTRYAERPTRQARTDEAVLDALKRPLQERHLLSRAQPMTIQTPDYDLEFPIAWLNGQTNVCDAVSLDYKRGEDIIKQADRWTGRAWNLNRTGRDLKIYLLLGRPTDPRFNAQFERARRILNSMPGKREVLTEDEAPRLVEEIERDIREHMDANPIRVH